MFLGIQVVLTAKLAPGALLLSFELVFGVLFSVLLPGEALTVSMAEVKECLHNHEVAGRIVIDDDIAAAIDAYYEQWGAKE